MIEAGELLTIKEASHWASELLGKNVTRSNISYLLQYGRIKKIGENGSALISKNELLEYYQAYQKKRQLSWKNKLGDLLNGALLFDQYKETETTKHVHRLHPYKGKFIPQLVEYFLDCHTDHFKKEACIKKGDILLDPFCGSGTTLVQCAELGIHAIGIDISEFNSEISNSKISKYNLIALKKEIDTITGSLMVFLNGSPIIEFQESLTHSLNQFNNDHFPVPQFKYLLKQGEIDEARYGWEKEKQFLPIYDKLAGQFKVPMHQKKADRFLDKWFPQSIQDEIQLVFEAVKKIKDPKNRKMISIILSRTIRSCRLTSHADLGTLVEPITKTYYCTKHGKICRPLYSILKWWQIYSKDSLKRLAEFDQLRTNTSQLCLSGDSQTINIHNCLEKKNRVFAGLLESKKIKAIFSSPPYVGLIDYHEQHAYAYDLFEFDRKDELEIGSLFKGQSREAKENYIVGISAVLNNCKKYLASNYDIFLVANDKHNLYPIIAKNSGMKIVQQYNRPVLNRTERGKGAFSETIFHLKKDRSGKP